MIRKIILLTTQLSKKPYISRYHVQTEKGVFPFLVVQDTMSASYVNIFFPSFVGAIEYSNREH